MAYAAQSDLLNCMTQQELTSLTDDTKSGQANVAIIDGKLNNATGMIDSYCRSRYATPLATSDTVVQLCCDITIYLLYSRRPQKITDIVRQSYVDAIAFLKDISTGKASLDQPVGAATPQTASAGAVRPTHDHLRFTERDLKGFV